MRGFSLKYVPLFLVFLAFIGCSRKKDKFVSRNFHALNTYYNILYNGNLALDEGWIQLVDPEKDNFWEFLPVEPISNSNESILLPGQSTESGGGNENFQRAEEKAVKAIQKHGMNIGGRERNPQIDEAYLLLGKSRYYDGRYLPAIEAFNYILFKYPSSDIINDSKVWREKTNMRLNNNALAIKNLKKILKREELDKQELSNVTSTIAQAYINIKVNDSALYFLKIAEQNTEKRLEYARFNFILGQLYNYFEDTNNANQSFDKVINLHRKIPRAYYINAHLQKASNRNQGEKRDLEFEEYLFELEENRENRPYLDKINNTIAQYFEAVGEDSLKIVYYNKALRSNSSDKFLKSNIYNTLAQYYFDNAEYKTAGAYYDSTLVNQVPKTDPYRITKRKRENLKDVISYEDIAVRDDSILKLMNMTEADRLAFFTDYTAKLKKAHEKALKEAKRKANFQDRLISTSSGSNIVVDKSKQQSFYFYSSTSVQYGRGEFKNKWGDRALKDNWRWSVIKKIEEVAENDSISIDGEKSKSKAENLGEFNPKTYLSQIPSSQIEKDSIIKEKNFAYYQLGILYKEKFKEYELSTNKFVALLDSQPEERLILPSMYNLYKDYVELKDGKNAEVIKKEIISKYPGSRYAQILLHPELALQKDENGPEAIYERLYSKFVNHEYVEVIKECEKYAYQFETEPIETKFIFLSATAKGKLYGYTEYVKALKDLALKFPDSEEGKRAKVIATQEMKRLSSKRFKPTKDSDRIKIVYKFEVSDESIDDFKVSLDKILKEEDVFVFKSSKDFYNTEYKFIVVHGLKSEQGAEAYAKILSKKGLYKDYFVISSGNYQTLQVHKNLKVYLKKE